MTSLPKTPNAESRAIRNASEGKTCTLAIPGICRRDPQYTVGLHLRFLTVVGMSEKPDDLFIVDGCDRCHEVLDDQSRWREVGLTSFIIFHALITTLKRRRAERLITLKGEKL